MNSPLFLVPLIVGLVFIIAGWILLKYPPKKINFIFGYRSQNSMKNQEIWTFAQSYSGKESIKAGLFLAVTSIPGLFFTPSENVAIVITLGIMLITILVFFIRVEKALVRKLKAMGQL